MTSIDIMETRMNRIKPRGPLGFVRQGVFHEATTPDFYRDIFSEFFNTFLYILITTSNGLPFAVPLGPLRAGLTTGFTIFILIETFTHVQGAHFNPVVTCVFLCTKAISWLKAIFYVFAQYTGAIAASGLVYYCSPPEIQKNMGPLGVGRDVQPFKGMLVEVALTMVFITVFMGTLDKNNRKIQMPGLPIGLSVGVGIMAGAQFSGGCMNPLVWFGPAAVSGKWKNWWVYHVGDFIGGLLAMLIYSGMVYRGRPFHPRDTVSKEKAKPEFKDEEKWMADDSGEGDGAQKE